MQRYTPLSLSIAFWIVSWCIVPLEIDMEYLAPFSSILPPNSQVTVTAKRGWPPTVQDRTACWPASTCTVPDTLEMVGSAEEEEKEEEEEEEEKEKEKWEKKEEEKEGGRKKGGGEGGENEG